MRLDLVQRYPGSGGDLSAYRGDVGGVAMEAGIRTAIAGIQLASRLTRERLTYYLIACEHRPCDRPAAVPSPGFRWLRVGRMPYQPCRSAR
jgi:hypothetical protein